MAETISPEIIKSFLEGRDPQKYIVAIEATGYDNIASLVINDPELGKRIELHKYEPFLWLKHDVVNLIYDGNRAKIKEAMLKHGVKIKALRVENSDGYAPKRLVNGYKYIATTTKTYYDLTNFFKNGGVDVYHKDTARLFVALTPVEQFLIQSGKRLFKGMDDYNDVHRLQFDLETEGLDPQINPIFQIGIRDNRGYERILETTGETEQERRDSERLNIFEFFNEVIRIKPDTIVGYNSDVFDWSYFYGRCERLGLDIEAMAKSLDGKTKIKRRDSQIKLGGETEYYKQTLLWGFNILDISHSVRRAQAINSDIKKWSLKYITKFSKIVKPNRVYIDGNKIHKTWADVSNTFYLNEKNGDWFKYEDDKQSHLDKIATGDYIQQTGAYIVRRYLMDDLWETEKVDYIYNQASFLLSKIIPTSYVRSSTMGTAGTWKLIMEAWSYENGLAIPEYEPKIAFTGGLSRLLEVGYAEDGTKLDYAALYPKTTLTEDIFPELDITNVMKGLLIYVVDTRDTFKNLMNDEKAVIGELEKQIKENNISSEELVALKTKIVEHKKKQSDYDKKQLPLKILANSFFGSYGAPHLFPWGETTCAERITCISRQNLRLMVKFFKNKYNFRPLVGDTDGFNFAMPKSISDIRYVAKGSHWSTTKVSGVELVGLKAAVADFNETHMTGWMGLDIDDVYVSTINFARKNYATLFSDGKVKLTGNTVKSKKMPTYIEEFFDKAISMLLHGDGIGFINYYNEYVDKIYNYQIPLLKIASKGKVNQTIDSYHKECKTTTKSGSAKSRKAHMELVIRDNVDVNMGDVIYYYNIGKAKSHGDVKVVTDKETKTKEIQFNCVRISESQLIDNPDLTTDEYNVPKYLDMFNSRISPLLVCFKPEIRNNILLNLKKDKKTKEFILDSKKSFTEKDCELCSGYPIDSEDQDNIDDFLKMEDKELKFWTNFGATPKLMSDEEWAVTKADYLKRLTEERLLGVQKEKDALANICMMLDVKDYTVIESTGEIPSTILEIANLNTHNAMLESIKFGDALMPLEDLFKYQEEAIERSAFYNLLLDPNDELYGDYTKEEKYAKWLEYKNEKEPDITPPKVYEPINTETSVNISEDVQETPIEIKQEEKEEWNF